MKSEDDRRAPWLTYPDGKWSPQLSPKLSPASSPSTTCEVHGYCFEREKELKRQWKVAQVERRSRKSVVRVQLGEGSCRNSFDIELRDLEGIGHCQVTRSLEDFESAHRELEHEYAAIRERPLLFPTQDQFPSRSLLLWRSQLQDASTALQWWLKEVIDAGLVHSRAFQIFLDIPNQAQEQSFGARDPPSRVVLSLPILSEVVEYLADPKDLVHICCTASKAVNESSLMFQSHHWQRIYHQRWPAFFSSLKHSSEAQNYPLDWQALYRETLAGRFDCELEVFDREKKLGFAMSCLVAKVHWEAETDSFVVAYLSASQVLPERIHVSEAHRLRFCPESVRSLLRPELQMPQASDSYAYRILTGIDENLKIGQGVELQWKMQLGSPFGWWYGTLEDLQHHSDGKTATATMVFSHFPRHSRWHRLHVIVGDGTLHRCSIGGHHGGLRSVSEAEKRQWMQFFPKAPVVF